MRWSHEAIFQADFFIGRNVAEERVYYFGLNTMFAFDKPDNLEQIFVHQLKSLVHMMVDLFNNESEKKTSLKFSHQNICWCLSYSTQSESYLTNHFPDMVQMVVEWLFVFVVLFQRFVPLTVDELLSHYLRLVRLNVCNSVVDPKSDTIQL